MSPFNPRFKGQIEKAHIKNQIFSTGKGQDKPFMHVRLLELHRRVMTEEATKCAALAYSLSLESFTRLQTVLPSNMTFDETPEYLKKLCTATIALEQAVTLLTMEAKATNEVAK